MIFNFTDDSGVLGYLRGKEVRLPDDAVWFLKDFEGGEVRTAPAAHKASPAAPAQRPAHSSTQRPHSGTKPYGAKSGSAKGSGTKSGNAHKGAQGKHAAAKGAQGNRKGKEKNK